MKLTKKQRERYAAGVGERVSKFRARRGMSQAELGKLVGASTSTISRIESGQQELTVSRALEIAAALGVSEGRLTSIPAGGL